MGQIVSGTNVLIQAFVTNPITKERQFVPIASATSVNFTYDMPKTAVNAIGSLSVVDYAVGVQSGNGSLSGFKRYTSQDLMNALGYSFDTLEVFTRKEQVRELTDGFVLFFDSPTSANGTVSIERRVRIQYCQVTSDALSINAGDIANETINFVFNEPPLYFNS